MGARMADTDPKTLDLLDLLAEAGQLKRVPRSGWTLAGIPQPESVAEHVYRTAIVGHALARLEGVDAGKVVLLYHDLPEARLGDFHRITSSYVDSKAATEAVCRDLAEGPSEHRGEVSELLEEHEARETPEAIVAKDADLLECILQGREYEAAGSPLAAESWRDKRDALRTDGARQLYDAIEAGWDPSAWRDGLKRPDRG